MRLALSLGAVNAANPAPHAHVELAAAAERCGYDAVWAAEIHATDPFSQLSWIGGHTTSIGLGCAVAQVTGRSAVTMAAGAVTLDGLSVGRFRLGIGVSGPRIVEGWHGHPYTQPLTYLREYLAILRLALAGQPISYAGRKITLPLPPGRGQYGVAPLPFPTPPSRLPVHLAGLGRNAVALAGELADGWIAIHCPPEYMARARSWLAAGAARSGRSLAGFSTSVMVICCVDNDEDLARDLVRPVLAVYLGGMGSREANFYNKLAARLGFERAAGRIQESFLAGDIGEAIAAVDDDLIDAMTIAGSEDHVRKRLTAYQEAGVDSVILGLAAPTAAGKIKQLELMSELVGRMPSTRR